jgi:betaine-homocysteine S-methyltransferase
MARGELLDGVSVEDGCRRLQEAGASVVGMNCFRGPVTMLPYLETVRAAVEGPVAALPVPYRTSEAHPTFFNMPDPDTSCEVPLESTFPTALDPFLCNRYEVRCFANAALDMGIRYLGLCCGAQPMHIREIAEAMGRTPPASRYSPDMSKHFLFGEDETLAQHMTAYRKKA